MLTAFKRLNPVQEVRMSRNNSGEMAILTPLELNDPNSEKTWVIVNISTLRHRTPTEREKSELNGHE